LSGPDDLLQAALAAHKAGRHDEAGALYERIIASDPQQADALNLSGMLRLQRGDAKGAQARISQAIAVRPREALYHANLAKALQAGGDRVGAAASLRQAAKLAPGQSGLWQQLGLILRSQGDFSAAADAFRRAAQAAPSDPAPLNNLAAVLLEQGRPGEARPAIVRALALDKDNPFALANEGQALLLEERPADAVGPLRRALAADPANAMTLNSLGIALQETLQLEESLSVLGRAAALAPQAAIIRVSYGNALKKSGRYDEAIGEFQQALRLRPDVAEIHSHIGTCHEGMMRYDAAIAAYDEALRLKPDYRRVQHNRGMALLTVGRFKNGWRDYAGRDLREDLAAGSLREAHGPDDIAGRHILLLGEQGLGDEIFFLRFLPELARRGAARISAMVSAKIKSLIDRVGGLDAVVSRASARPPADTVIAVGDLPMVLRMSSVDQIPPSLRIEPLPERASELAARLAALGPPPYIGVTWRAGTADRLGALFKLAPLADIGAALAGLSGTLIALQRLPQTGEIAALATAAAKPVHDLTALNDDLEGMLALLAQLDDYVCVSNTNVHLRAMVGRTCRVLIPAPPDFRWMADGDESPWFPGSRVYRQTPTREWSGALAALKRDLAAAFA